MVKARVREDRDRVLRALVVLRVLSAGLLPERLTVPHTRTEHGYSVLLFRQEGL